MNISSSAKRNSISFAVAIATVLVCASQASAKTFHNAYVSFEMPDKWDCVMEATEWVCRPSNPAQAQQAIIVLTAKEIGPNDNLSSYEQHLKQPRVIANRGGQMQPSLVEKVENRTISGQPWVDGMHLSSEVPNYYTRYLATTKEKIAVLVTFSAHKLYYSQYTNDFFRAINSLVVIAQRSLMSGAAGTGGVGGAGNALGPGGMSAFGGAGDDPGGNEVDPAESGGLTQKAKTIGGLALIIGAVGIYLLVKKSGKKKKR